MQQGKYFKAIAAKPFVERVAIVAIEWMRIITPAGEDGEAF
jgi:hypothetical protein